MRKQQVEATDYLLGMFAVHRKDDGLAYLFAAFNPEAFRHQLIEHIVNCRRVIDILENL